MDGDPPPAVRGTVTDPDGNLPLVGAEVTARWTDDGESEERRTRTDLRGRFAFCDVEGASDVELRAQVASREGPERVLRPAALEGGSASVSLRAPLDDPEASTGVLARVVGRETGEPVQSAEVRLGDRSERTNREGTFAFRDLPAGTYVLEIEHLAYGSFADTLHLAPGRPLQMRIPVAADPIPLDELRVTVRSSLWLRQQTDFYRRMEEGRGRFITRSEIEELGEPPMSSLLRRVPGMRLRVAGSTPFGQTHVPVIRNCGIPAIYVDGARITLMTGPGTGIDEFRTGDIEGIEIYSGASTAPIRQNRDAACGVIQIWTRRGW